jgi:hypothetical protein
MHRGLLVVVPVLALVATGASVVQMGYLDRLPKEDPRAAAFYADGYPPYDPFFERALASNTRYRVHTAGGDSSDIIGDGSHEIMVTDSASGRVRRAVRLRVPDPGSGRAHQANWSPDGSALLIHGRASLRGRIPDQICMVYLVASDELLTPPTCPDPTYQRQTSDATP